MRRLVRAAAAEWRQRSQPAAFRIGPGWDVGQQAVAEQIRAAAIRAATIRAESTTDRPDPDQQTLDEHALADAATNLWRASRRLDQDGRASATARQAGHYVRNCSDAMGAAGIVATDHAGIPYDPGLAMTVLEWTIDPDLDHDQVVRTVRPSIYLHGRCIQQAQVIVGGPPQKEDGE